MKKVNITLDEEVHRKVKLLAILKDITMNEFFEQAIAEALKKEEHLLKNIPRLDKKK